MCYLFDFYPITYTQVIRYSRACRNYRTLLFDGQDSDAKTTQTGSMLCQDCGHPFTSSMAVITN